jgi:HlyD family secretion protein
VIVRFRTGPDETGRSARQTREIFGKSVRSRGKSLALHVAEAMDRPIDATVQQQRRLRRAGTATTVIAIIVAALIWLPGLVRPSVRRSAVRTAVTDAGPIESVITATGTVVPEVEQVVSSPVDARVLRILARTGAALKKGDPLVTLDVSEAQLTVDKLIEDQAIKENEQASTRLKLEKSLIDLNGKVEVKSLQLASLRSQLERDRQLAADGLLSQELLKKSDLAVAQATIELKQLEGERDNARVANRTELDGLALEMSKLRKESHEARRVLELATPRADRDGVLTQALTEEGVAIRKGDVIARVADLRSFRVDATVSDVHAGRLATGLPVVVRLNDVALEGRVARVLPTIQNGAVTLHVALTNPSSPLLRSNLRVDVGIVTARKPRAVRIKRGPFATGEGVQQVFVIRGDRAVRTPVELGLASFDQVEVVRGLVEGDEAIISDMSDYMRLKEVRIR